MSTNLTQWKSELTRAEQGKSRFAVSFLTARIAEIEADDSFDSAQDAIADVEDDYTAAEVIEA